MTEYVIDVHDLRKVFNGRAAVDGVSLRVAAGEICGFLGANGSGKTTTIRLLCGLLIPDGGGGTCLGLDIIRDAPIIRRQVGYMTQRFSYYEDLTIRENLELVAGVYEMQDGKAAIDGIVERMNLSRYADDLAGHLSGGWKQRLALAACVLHRPKLLLLDEPTAGVDVRARREFWDLIHDMAVEGLTVLVSTHYMDEAARCKRVIYLANGRIVVEGASDEVARKSGLISYEATGDSVDTIARDLRLLPGVEAAAVFGNVLHVTGSERALVEHAIHGAQAGALVWHEVAPGLEDVFIHNLAKEDEDP